MTKNQEDALYDFLENTREAFTIEEITSFVRLVDFPRGNLAREIASFLDSQNIAFRVENGRWLSRRGCFEPIRFVISPVLSELRNGILIPGHRCVPFANPLLLPPEYTFFWKGSQIPFTSMEGPPEEFYPYYSVFGEEYAPQYVARDNPANESAFNSDPYEDPPDVSIQVLDMRNLYREISFVPGDRFVVKTLDWKAGSFELERVGKDEWSQVDLYAWHEAADTGFEDSFSALGPGASTEEQIAYAYWFGGKRMRDVPAYALEDYLYERTDKIESAAYGIETRFWYAGKEIPDLKGLDLTASPPDRTPVEEVLYRNGIPVSEFVVQAYLYDALFRRDLDIANLAKRIVPPSVGMDSFELTILSEYAADVLSEFQKEYSPFKDSSMGPIRQRMAELHSAVIDLAARLGKDADVSWLPKHTFIILSQIQGHAAGVMEDLDSEEVIDETELEAMDNSLDSMIETYEDIKELIEEAKSGFRRRNLSVVKPIGPGKETWCICQISLGGTDVWRRLALPESCRLRDLQGIIRVVLGWSGGSSGVFILEGEGGRQTEGDPEMTLEELSLKGGSSLVYEYGSQWIVKILFLSRHEKEGDEAIRCIAGAGAAPPEQVGGPLKFRRFAGALEKGKGPEFETAVKELGEGFDPNTFDTEACNRKLSESAFNIKKQEKNKNG
jgi:hypothetical protein